MIQVYHNPNFEADSKSGKLSSWEKCIHVADVNTDNLEEALEAVRDEGEINFKEHLVVKKNGQVDRATKDGDILVHNNQKYLLETFGFLALEDSEIKLKEEPKKDLKKERTKKSKRLRL